MAGHSKWHNIKRKKEAQDKKRAAKFSRLSKLIMVEAREGGGDPDKNPSLRTLIDKAKDADMPKDNIERAIKKGTGELEGVTYEKVIYEGYGPEGVAFLVRAQTDNSNRTVAELRLVFEEHGGSLGDSGSAAYIFSKDAENPSFEIEVEDENKLKKLNDLINTLENHDDIEKVYTNLSKEVE